MLERIRHEQGFGDSIQMLRYLPLLHQKSGKFIVWLQPQFQSLLNAIPNEMYPNVELRFKEPNPEEFTHYALLMSLPHIFGTTIDTIPGSFPYIYADKILASQWKTKIEGYAGKKIGIVWSTGFPNPTHYLRSCDIEHFHRLAKLPGLTLFSLQKGEHEKDLQKLPDSAIVPLSNDIKTFSDSAAIIDNLDLVITVDTFIAHLAGAMGKPVWNLLNYISDWRWHLEVNVSRWYPTIELIRQPKQNDWWAVFSEVKKRLEKEVNRES